ncbi:MAG: BatD family protein [Melioribacteraceae bacterium]|nr:BatD family protein [Melioribacteraceae bacterium]MCF8263853.1 BatD family protein [Melioribacteraceae bacterium]
MINLIRNITLFLVCFVTANAQNFTATVDKTKLGQNERFKVYFKMEAEDINSLRNFQAPSFEGFRILSGPNQSTNMQIINGSVSASLTYTYILQTIELGKFTIGSAKVNYKGKNYSTDPLVLEVVKSSANNDVGGVSNEDLAGSVFIRAIPSKTNVYQGEQVTVEYKLYTKANISSPQISKLPTYNGFWTEELETSPNIRFNIEMYNGERFRAATIKRVALFPTKSGELTVTPFELTVPVILKKRRSGRDVFDEFFNDSFFGRTETIEFLAKSNELKVNVKSLPAQKPESFKGAVGNFDFNAQIDKQNVEINEAVTIKINISGTGNIELLDIPEIKIPPGFEKYDPKTSSTVNKKNTVSGIKNLEYIMVPRIPGKKTIPAIEFSFFNTKTGKYETKTAGPFVLNISAPEGTVVGDVSGLTKEEVTLLSSDIRFIKTNSYDFRKKDELGKLPGWFWYLSISPLVLLLLFLGYQKRRNKISGNIQLLKFKKAEKAAKNRLKKAKKAMEQNSLGLFYSENAAALFGYLEDKLGIQKSEFTLEKALEQLRSLELDEELLTKLQSTSEKSEFARFAPSAQSDEDARNLYDSTVHLIVDLDSKIDSARIK